MDVFSTNQRGKSFDWNLRRSADSARMVRKPNILMPWAPASVAQRLRALMVATDQKPSEIADLIGLDRSSMTKVLKGEKPLKPELAFEICERYGVTMDFIYRGQVRDLPTSLSKAIITALNTDDL